MHGPLSARKRDHNLSNSAQQQDPKRYKYEGSRYAEAASTGIPTLDAIVECIFGLSDLQNVEVEFKVGKFIADKQFRSTLTEPNFQFLCGQVKKQAQFTCGTDYKYDHGRYNNACLTVDDEGGVTRAFHVEPLSAFHMQTNLPFDMRVTIARETPITPLPAVIDDDYTYKAGKAQFTVASKDWLLSIIDSTADDAGKTYDLAVQVKMSSIKACADHRACVSLLGSVFVEVHNLLAQLHREAQIFPDIKLERVTSQDLCSYLKREFMKLIPGVHTQDRFPGSQPTPLERNKIKVLQTGKYWVSEKSDGLRLMLFFIDGCAYFVDRKLDFFQIHKFSFLVDLFGRKGVSLIDGEMVRHLRTGKLMFLIFDILALNGKTNLGAYGLLDRLSIITKQVVEVFRAACKVCNMKDDSSRLQFSLAGKIFRNKSGIELLADMIKIQETGERLFIDERRCHRNDGLIFTLDGPYLPYSSSHLMKWKYVDRLTIDFRLKILPNDRYSTTVGAGKNKEQEIRNFDMTTDNWEKLKADIQKSRNPNGAIIECAFDAVKGQWCYLNLRPDKDMPNHYNTMENMKRIVVENITMEELVYRVPKDTASDDWEKIHPELFLPRRASSPVSDKSPSSVVDLPATPVDSPLSYLSPSPSRAQLSPPLRQLLQLRQQASPLKPQVHDRQLLRTLSLPPPMTYENIACTDNTYFKFVPPSSSSAPSSPISISISSSSSSSSHDDVIVAALPFDDSQSFSSLINESPPPLLFESQNSPAYQLQTLSPPTSPSAFFS